MNISIKDILSNPALLNNVSEDVLQQWKQQYPYVSLFHLYALKKKRNYSNAELHTTAFYFNNREKLYYLLQEQIPNYNNNTSSLNNTIEIKSDTIPLVEEIATNTAEIVDFNIKNNEEKNEPIIEETLAVNNIVTAPINTIANTNEPLSIADKILLEIEQLKKERNQPANIETNNDTNLVVEEKNTLSEIVVEPIISDIKTEENIEDEIQNESITTIENNAITKETINNINNENDIDNTLIVDDDVEIKTPITTNEPLSIAEKILLEIEQLKKERDQPAVTSNEIKSTTTNEETTAKTAEIVAEKIVLADETIEQQIIETPQLSIQEEVIARIQKLKEEREAGILQTDDIKTVSETNEIIDNSTTTIETPEIVESIDEKTALANEIIEQQTIETPTLSIQEEVIARIQKLKEEREAGILQTDDTKTTSESNEIIDDSTTAIDTNIPINTVDEKIILDEITIDSITENEVEVNTDIVQKEEIQDETNTIVTPTIHEIAIVEKDNLSDINIEQNETKAIFDEPQKEITLKDDITITNTTQNITEDTVIPNIQTQQIEETASTEINKSEENNAVAKTDESHITISTIDTIEDNHFANSFPTPLLVNINTEEIFTKNIVVQNEETIGKSENESESKIKTTVVENKSEENKEENIAIFIPEIKINEPLAKEIINTEIPTIEITINKEKEAEKTLATIEKIEQTIKEEPHTFIEWLQMLDGNLQIQSNEKDKEKELNIDNWIEVPRYEVEQTITHKKEIQKEEQKLFEPNFEEGEIDLFHEIDEAVTKIATESILFKNDMMTETLAKIYYKQGKLDKSLEIYNTLLIKYPEKSAYFASLIEKIEKEK